MGGKNSMFHKPFGAGTGSVNKVVADAVGPTGKRVLDAGTSLAAGAATGTLAGNIAGVGGALTAGGAKGMPSAGATANKLTGAGNEQVQGSTSNLSIGQIRGFMEEGERKGETISGSTMQEVGEGRKMVRDRLQETLDGNSAGANALRQDQAQQQKNLRAQQAVAGQGQMNEGQQQALQRQANRDLAGFVSNEQRQALSDISKEFRGAGGDIMRSSGQYGSVLVGAQPAAMPRQTNGLLTNLFGGLF